MVLVAGMVAAATAQETKPPQLTVRAERARVEPKAQQTFTVSVTYPAASPTKAEVALTVIHNLDDRIPLAPLTITVPAGGEAKAAIPWTPDREYWGCRVVAETKLGEKTLRATDIFTVSTDVFAASPICQTLLGTNLNNAPPRLAAAVESVRQDGGLILEHFSWQASPWGPIYPRQEVWQAGMSPSGRTDRKAHIPYLADQVHQRGMTFMCYAITLFAGPAGYQWAKEHPQDVKYPAPDAKLPIENKLASTAAPNLLRGSALDQGIDEYIKCVKEFGYDGIRWDGHPGVFYHPYRDAMHRANRSTALPGFDHEGNLLLPDDVDETNVKTWRTVRGRFEKECPGILFGFNMGLGFYAERGFNTSFPRAFAETARGNMVIDEKQMNPGHGDGVPSQVQNKTWSRAKRSMLHSADLIRAVCGVPYRGPVYGACEPFGKHCYSLFFAGATHVWGAGGIPTGWGRFALRFNRLLFHPSLVRADRQVKVTAKGSTGDLTLWHDEFVYDLFTNGRLYAIVHLLNPPVSDTVNVKTTKPPAQSVESASVVFDVPRGLKGTAARFFVLSPEWEESCRPAEVTPGGRWATVRVPAFRYWAFAVMEIPVNVRTIVFPEEIENWFLQIERNPQTCPTP